MNLKQRLLSVVLMSTIGVPSLAQHVPAEENRESEAQPESRTSLKPTKEILEDLVKERLAEIEAKKKEIAIIKEAFKSAHKNRNRTFMVAIPVGLLGALAVKGGVSLLRSGSSGGDLSAGFDILGKLIGAGLAVGGTAAAGGSIYFMYVSQSQKNVWESKLNKAEEELTKNQEELEKIKSRF